mmetsp:Transcript_28023/g.39126  ORF Transcript_28023/g.39126 Transcript_28023/m.39126 type:complete len:155 (-) Transcript_28023:52-516(-)
MGYYLLKAKADITVQNHAKRDCLLTAVRHGNRNLVFHMLEKGIFCNKYVLDEDNDIVTLVEYYDRTYNDEDNDIFTIVEYYDRKVLFKSKISVKLRHELAWLLVPDILTLLRDCTPELIQILLPSIKLAFGAQLSLPYACTKLEPQTCNDRKRR